MVNLMNEIRIKIHEKDFKINVFSAGMYETMIIVRGSSTLPLRGNLIVKDSINRAGKHQSSSLTNSPTVRTRNMAEAEDNSIGANSMNLIRQYKRYSLCSNPT